MSPGFDHLTAGLDALKRKDFADAEALFMAAYQAHRPDPYARPGSIDFRWTACCHLGSLYRKTGRYDEAMHNLEQALPLPAAFKELITMYRDFAKRMKQDGDGVNSAEWYRRMYCLAKINATVLTIRVPGVPVAVDWGRAADWLEDVRRQCGSLYAYQFDGQEIPGDDLLTPTDYKALRGGRA